MPGPVPPTVDKFTGLPAKALRKARRKRRAARTPGRPGLAKARQSLSSQTARTTQGDPQFFKLPVPRDCIGDQEKNADHRRYFQPNEWRDQADHACQESQGQGRPDGTQ